jgi:hypothetical protein
MNTLEKLIKKHKFGWVNDNITEANFPDDGRRGKDYKLFHFKKSISSERVIEEMEKEGYQPATIYELLEWKDWNDKDWVVTLGSTWRDSGGCFFVPFLGRSGSERYLDLRWFGSEWYVCCRFLVVRKYSDTKTLKFSDPLILRRLGSLEKDMEALKKIIKF